MRTTLDLPDELFRQLKAHAALQGKTLREIFVEWTQRELGARESKSAPMGRRQTDFVD